MNGDLSTSCNLSNCDCDKPKPMPDQRARAKQITREICSGLGTVYLSAASKDILIQHIESALSDERRRVWEEAKLIADTVAAKHPAPEDWMARLAAVSISNLMDAKAHAGQEG